MSFEGWVVWVLCMGAALLVSVALQRRSVRKYASSGTGVQGDVRYRWRTWAVARRVPLFYLEVEVDRRAGVPDFRIVREWGGNAALHDWAVLKEMQLGVPGKAHWDYDHYFSTPDREALRAYLLADTRRCEAIGELFALSTHRVESDPRGVRVELTQWLGAKPRLTPDPAVAALSRLAGA